MRAVSTTSGVASAAATSILRSLSDTPPAHLEPAFRVLSPLSSLLSLVNRGISTTSTSFLAPPPPPHQHFEDITSKKIITLPQLSSAMQSAYTSRRYDQVLSLYSQGDDRIIKPASKTDPRAAAMTYDCALKACAAAAAARQAQSILSTMWKRGVPVGRVAQGSVLKALCAAGQRQAAFQHLKAIPAARVTTMHCNTVLSACAAAHDTTIGLKVWEFMKRRGVELDNVSFCEALRVFGAAGNVEKLTCLWENEIHPVVFSGTINSSSSSTSNVTATTSLEAVENMEESDEEVLLQRSKESKTMVAAAYAGALAAAGQVELSMAQCASIMDMLTHLLPQELHLAIELETGRTDNHQLHMNNSNSNASSSSSGGRQTAAPLDNLRSACNAVLHAAVSSHQWHYLRKMVALMTSRGLPPDVITYNALLKAAVKRGEGPQPIHEGMAEMKALGLHPNSTTYTLLIEAYASEGDVEGAHSVFNSIADPGSATWNALLRAHAGIGDLTGLGQTFQLMVNQGEVVPDESTYITCFEGISTGVRKHTSTLESINALTTSGDGDSDSGERGSEHLKTSTQRDTSSVVESKKIAMDVLHQVEQHMKKKFTAAPSSSHAMRAALVKAHGALHHTAIVWSLLADEYIYNHVLSSNKTTIQKNNRIVATPPDCAQPPPPLPVAAVYHALPPKPKKMNLAHTSSTSTTTTESETIETELLQALSKSISTTSASKSNSTIYPPRVLNAGIPQLVRAGRVDLIIQLLSSLSKSGHCPDSDTYAALISACAGSGYGVNATSGHSISSSQHQHQLRPEFAPRLLAHMEEPQQQHHSNGSKVILKPCARVYNALLRVECARAGVTAALDVVEGMKTKAIYPDTHTWMVLRGCAVGHGRSDVAEQAMYEIRMLKHAGDSTNRKKESGNLESQRAPTDDPPTPQEDERHWKGYYASDEEDEW